MVRFQVLHHRENDPDTTNRLTEIIIQQQGEPEASFLMSQECFKQLVLDLTNSATQLVPLDAVLDADTYDNDPED